MVMWDANWRWIESQTIERKSTREKYSFQQKTTRIEFFLNIWYFYSSDFYGFWFKFKITKTIDFDHFDHKFSKLDFIFYPFTMHFICIYSSIVK